MFHVLNCWKRPCWFEIPPSYCIGGSIVKLTVKKKSIFTSMRGVVVIYFGFLFLLSYSFLLYLVTKFLCFVSMTSWNFVKKKLWTPSIILSHIFLSVSLKTFFSFFWTSSSRWSRHFSYIFVDLDQVPVSWQLRLIFYYLSSNPTMKYYWRCETLPEVTRRLNLVKKYQCDVKIGRRNISRTL